MNSIINNCYIRKTIMSVYNWYSDNQFKYNTNTANSLSVYITKYNIYYGIVIKSL